MADRKIGKGVLELETDDSKLKTGLDTAEGKVKGWGTRLGGITKAIGGAAAGLFTSSLIGGLSDAANAAADDEASVLALQQAIENTGASYGDYVGTLGDVIKKGQDLAFTDDQTRAALQMLTEETGSVDEALARLPQTMDLARAKHIDLVASAKLLGKVSDENTKGLKKLGIVMDAGATATDVLAKVQEIAGGQAKAYGDSTRGMIDRTKDGFAEWRESIGAATGPAMGLVALMPGLSSGMQLAGVAVGGLSSLIKLTFIPSLIALAIPFLPLILAIGAIGLAVGLLAIAWSNNWGDIQGKTSAVVRTIQDVFDGMKLFVLTVFRNIVTGVTGFVNGIIGIINGFIEKYNALAGVLHMPLIGTISLITPNLDAIDMAIANVARDREARIFANVYEQAIAGGGGTPMYAEGTPYVPETGLAYLHRGEAVLTAEENAARGSAGGADRPIIVQSTLVLNGHEIAHAMSQYDRATQRRYGTVLDPSAT